MEQQKRLVIEGRILNHREIFEVNLKKQIQYWFYAFCGVWQCGMSHDSKYYCALCCIWYNEKEIVDNIAKKISTGLAEKGIVNEFKTLNDNDFQIIIHKMETMKQLVSSDILEKKILKKLNKIGVKAVVQINRQSVSNHTDDIPNNNNNTVKNDNKNDTGNNDDTCNGNSNDNDNGNDNVNDNGNDNGNDNSNVHDTNINNTQQNDNNRNVHQNDVESSMVNDNLL